MVEKVPLRERLKLTDNQRWVLCFILFFVSAFITLSIVSHYFTWRSDQMGGAVNNGGGSLGLAIANFLVGDWFGIFALCIPIAGFLLSLRVSRSESGYAGRMVKILLMVMVLGSVTFGFVTRADGAFGSGIGGKMGIDVAEWAMGYIGRLGLGLLLFTNDGDVTRQLTHPSLEKKKIYQVTLDKPLTRADMEQMTEGITLEDGDIFADEIAYASEDKRSVGVEIHSGRNRIVRRIFEHLGYTVQKLDRVYYAGLTKKNLKRGAWRFLTADEVARLKAGRYE